MILLGATIGACLGWALAWSIVLLNPQPRPAHELQVAPLSAEMVRTSAAIIEARRAGIPPDLAVAVSRWEVRNADSLARGRDGEIGYFQVTPRYWANEFPECYPDRPLYNPERNACIGTRALRRSFEQTGNWPDALRKYNGSLRLPEAGRKYVKGVERQRLALNGDTLP